MVETIRATVALLEKNEQMSQAALANTMGLDWRANVSPGDPEIPFEPYAADLDQLVSTAYRWNLDWEKLEAGLRALEGAETTARSGYYPKLAMTVDLQQLLERLRRRPRHRPEQERLDPGPGREDPHLQRAAGEATRCGRPMPG